MSKVSHQRGFTLIEMLVTISILVLLSAMVVVNFRDAEKGNAVRLGAEQFVGVLREAQNYALAQKRVVVGKDSIVPAGYGVYIKLVKGQTTEAVFFADTGPKLGLYEPKEDLEIRTEELPRYAVFSSLLGGATDELSLIFSPPDGAVNFGNLPAELSATEVAVVIQLYLGGEVGGTAKSVIVNSLTSLIEIKDF